MSSGRTLLVKVKPNARQSSLERLADGSWLAQLKSPPVDGKANAELIALVAREFGCAKSAVEIASGAMSTCQRYGASDVRRITGITAFCPASAHSTAARPTASACSRSVFEAMWRAERCR